MAEANPSVVHNPNQPHQPNHSLDRRRDERAMEQLAQDSAQRITELTASSLEAWQKQLDVATQMAKFWVDTLHVNQQAFNQITQQLTQTRRSA
jgi:hypothetical protein